MDLIGFLALAIFGLAWLGGAISWLVVAYNVAMSWARPHDSRYRWRAWRAAGVFVSLWLVGVGAHSLGFWLGNWGTPQR
jgi:hypothetical protein